MYHRRIFTALVNREDARATGIFHTSPDDIQVCTSLWSFILTTASFKVQMVPVTIVLENEHWGGYQIADIKQKAS
jgi:hypothetical protein